MPVRGWDTVTVPGACRPGSSCTRKFGKLPFKKLFEPAIHYGREGFLVSPTIAGQWAAQVPELKEQPGFAEAFLPDGRAPRVRRSDSVSRPHAQALEEIAATKGKAFYSGELAEKIEAHAKKHGGAMRASDLAAHRPDWVKPLEMDYRGYTLHEIPPNGQGIVALMALGILEHFDVRSHPGRRRRQPAPADRGDEARLRRCATPTSPTSTTWTVPARSSARQGLPEKPGEADRPEARAGFRPRHAAEGRHGVSHRGRRLRHDGLLHPVELHGLRLGRGGGRHLAAEPRRHLRARSPATRTASGPASARTRPSSRASSRRTASR